MMLKLGKSYPPDDELDSEWIFEGEIHDTDRCNARQNHNEQKVKAILDAPPQKIRKMENKQQQRAGSLFGERKPVTWNEYEQGFSLQVPFLVNESPSHGMTMNRDLVCLFNSDTEHLGEPY
jgi:hypothetical protein